MFLTYGQMNDMLCGLRQIENKCFLYIIPCIPQVRPSMTFSFTYQLTVADKKYETIILPIFGVPTPFHISTIKVSLSTVNILTNTWHCDQLECK